MSKKSELEINIETTLIKSFLNEVNNKSLYKEIFEYQEAIGRKENLNGGDITAITNSAKFFIASYLMFDNQIKSSSLKFNNSNIQNNYLSILASEATSQYLLKRINLENRIILPNSFELNYNNKDRLCLEIATKAITEIKQINTINSNIKNNLASYYNTVKANSQSNILDQTTSIEGDLGLDDIYFKVNSPYFNFEIDNGRLISPLEQKTLDLHSRGKSTTQVIKPTIPKMNYSNVVGLQSQKEYMEILLSPLLKSKDNWIELNQGIDKSCNYHFLFHGPPGTGKTYFSQAIAGELNLPFYGLTGSDFVEGLQGAGKHKLIDTYEQASNKHDTSIVFIDEVDSFAQDRGSHGMELKQDVFNTFLTLLDGVQAKKNVITIISSNLANKLDTAARSRFKGGAIYFPPPSMETQLNVFKYHLGNHDISDKSLKEYINRLGSNEIREIALFAENAAKVANHYNSNIISINYLNKAHDMYLNMRANFPK